MRKYQMGDIVTVPMNVVYQDASRSIAVSVGKVQIVGLNHVDTAHPDREFDYKALVDFGKNGVTATKIIGINENELGYKIGHKIIK